MTRCYGAELDITNLTTLLGTVIVVMTALGVGAASFMRGRSSDWEGVARARLEAIKDRDRDMKELRHEHQAEMRGMAERLAVQAERITALETTVEAQKREISDLQKHDLTSVSTLLERLAGDLRTELFPIIMEIHKAVNPA